jgi:hypothetical protein
MDDHYIKSIDALRQLFPEPTSRAIGKQLGQLDRHCRRFIELSPFVVMATMSRFGADASPRGGAAGFVKVVDDGTLLIPDAPGNNRLDSLSNIVESGAIGLLFLIPGVDETLRVNGTARLSVANETLLAATDERRTPKLVIEVTVKETFLHCAKALMRSALWSNEARQERSILPTMAAMLAEQVGTNGPVESQEEMVARYQKDL